MVLIFIGCRIDVGIKVALKAFISFSNKRGPMQRDVDELEEVSRSVCNLPRDPSV